MPPPVSDAAMEMLRSNADWADTFSGADAAPTTSLAQRYRHNQDKLDYANALNDQLAAHQADVQAHDVQGATVAKINADLAMQREMHTANMAKVQNELDSKNQAGAFFSELPYGPPPGDPDHPAYVSGLANKYPQALGIPAVKDAVLSSLKKHQDIADFQQAISGSNLAVTGAETGPDGQVRFTARSPNSADNADDRNYWTTWQQSHKEASVLGRDYGVDVQYTPDGMPSIEATRKYAETQGLTKGKSTEHVPDAIQTIYSKMQTEQAKRGYLLSQQTDPAAKENLQKDIAENGAAADALVKTFPSLHPTQRAAAQPVSAPAPGIRALAQKALDDPNATPEHKAAAQRILANAGK